MTWFWVPRSPIVAVRTEGLIGLFLNMLVLRTDLSGDPAFAEVLGRVRAVALAAYDHQNIPFEYVVDAMVPERDRSRTPLFQVLSVTAKAGAGARQSVLAAWLSVVSRRPGNAKFDLSLFLTEAGGGGLAGGFGFSAELFYRSTVVRMAGHLVRLLEAVADDPGRCLSQLPVVTAGERRELARWMIPRCGAGMARGA